MNVLRRVRTWIAHRRWSGTVRDFLLGIYPRIRRATHLWIKVGRLSTTPLGRHRLRLALLSRGYPVLAFLAKTKRRTLLKRVRLIAVVGSFGKTTATRAVLAALGLDPSRHIGWNALSGLANSLISISPRTKRAVLEVGISKVGQMEAYAQMLRPDIVVVTCIGSEHMTSLGSLEVTRAEKAKMVAAVPSTGVVILNGDDPNVLWMKELATAPVMTYGFGKGNQVRAVELIENTWSGLRFTVEIDGRRLPLRTQLMGRHMAYPILAAIAVAQAEGLDLGQSKEHLAQLPPTHNRLEPIRLPGGASILLDAFKGALETIECALDTLDNLPASRKILVVGDVEEPPSSQGPLYKKLGARMADICDHVVFVGGKTNYARLRTGLIAGGLARGAMSNTRTDPPAIVRVLSDLNLRTGDVVLIKGRSSQHLERAALLLEGTPVACVERFCAYHHSCVECAFRLNPL